MLRTSQITSLKLQKSFSDLVLYSLWCTNMCSMILKETMLYYVTHHSPVFCTMLDATKAFDRVRYTKLFRLLLARRLPPVVLRVLLFMYTHSTAAVVSWNGSFSRHFCVKQGGVLSSVLFCLF